MVNVSADSINVQLGRTGVIFTLVSPSANDRQIMMTTKEIEIEQAWIEQAAIDYAKRRYFDILQQKMESVANFQCIYFGYNRF